MAEATRVLFVSGEVDPFAKVTETANLVRTLPEKLVERGDYETRIMMPRYGTISERRNRLHEVIRLSGNIIANGDREEQLKVKVASIPGIRLQVYFMDNNHYFKRKGVYAEKSGKVFPDNAERALFFARAAIETTRNLGWQPDIIHAHCWMSGFLPLLLRTEYRNETLFQNTKTIFTPASGLEETPFVSEELIQKLDLGDVSAEPMDLNDLGMTFADAVIYGPEHEGDMDDAVRLPHEPEEMSAQAHTLYAQVLEADGAFA